MRRSRWTPWRLDRRTRTRKRVLLVLLSDAANLTAHRICTAAQIGPGAVFAVLDQLETGGYVTGTWDDHPANQERRRFYRLTEAGRTEALHELWLTPRQETERA